MERELSTMGGSTPKLLTQEADPMKRDEFVITVYNENCAQCPYSFEMGLLHHIEDPSGRYPSSTIVVQ